jgi:hypothetical protein
MPDSQFFVFNLYSSGGHSPWHFPMWFFSRRMASVAPLQNYIADPVTDAKLSVSAADIVEVTTTALSCPSPPAGPYGRVCRGDASMAVKTRT